jgi:hypothetical protein
VSQMAKWPISEATAAACGECLLGCCGQELLTIGWITTFAQSKIGDGEDRELRALATASRESCRRLGHHLATAFDQKQTRSTLKFQCVSDDCFQWCKTACKTERAEFPI